MSISTFGGTTSDNYQLISSVTPTAAATAVNFTGLAVYKKLLLWSNNIVLGTAGTITLRLNNDSGANNYAWALRSRNNSATPVEIDGSGSSFRLNSAVNTTANYEGYIAFNNCDVTGIKFVEESINQADSAASNYYTSGAYRGTSVISEVNLLVNTTFTAAGTVSLYGVK